MTTPADSSGPPQDAPPPGTPPAAQGSDVSAEKAPPTTPADSSGPPQDAPPPGTPPAAQGWDVSAEKAPPTTSAPLRFGLLRGVVVVPADFDAPLPNEVQASFEET